MEGGCLREQMEWLELQVGSEDGWTAPPGLESVSAGDTPVLWGCFCSVGSLSVQRAWVPLGAASTVTRLRGLCASPCSGHLVPHWPAWVPSWRATTQHTCHLILSWGPGRCSGSFKALDHGAQKCLWALGLSRSL